MEVYNHEELRKGLLSHKFRTGNDCDVIAHLYGEYGENFVDMLDGMFSFVLLDTRDNSFIIARDSIGITSLYIEGSLDATKSSSSVQHLQSFFPAQHLRRPSSKELGAFCFCLSKIRNKHH